MNYVAALDQLTPSHNFGSKAQRLAQLAQVVPHVPRTWAVAVAAHDRYRRGDRSVLVALRQELTAVIRPNQTYAIRSSATVEDSAEHAFAGQFLSVLDVSGIDAAVNAVARVWDSAESETVRAYVAHRGTAEEAIGMGVIIQEMVPPVISGIAFSRNPLTGLDEIIVEAVRGRGDRLAQDGVTPARWVQKWGQWIQQPASDSMPIALIGQVATETARIAKESGQPVDLEWVYDGATLFWVQIRPITALENIHIYSNRIAKEVLPGLIKPLVWSVNVPLVNGAWVRLFAEMIGPHHIDPLSLSRSFYYRAYFNMGTIGEIFALLGLPRDSLEMLMGLEGGADRPGFRPSGKTIRLLPRMVRFVWRMWRFGGAVEAFIGRIDAVHATFQQPPAPSATPQQLLAEIDRLFAVTQKTAYFNIVTPLLNQLYQRLLRGRLQKRGIDPVTFDVTHGMVELRDYDPNWHLAHGIDEAAFLDKFGYLSDSGNDFSVPTWREQPDIVRRLLAHTELTPTARPKTTIEDVRRVGPLLRTIYQRARRFAYYREAISAAYTVGYGLFRDLFLALGTALMARGILQAQDDVFFLTLDEVRSAVAGGVDSAEFPTLVADRRAALDAARDITPPEIIYGDEEIPLADTSDPTLTGIPTARGYFHGPVQVVNGIADFDSVQPGSAIVIPFSDVGWTPLFAKAGAVIAESGGMLSHSSIVAREYHVPCVVSVPNACRRLANATTVTVDGYTGAIVVHEAPAGAIIS